MTAELRAGEYSRHTPQKENRLDIRITAGTKGLGDFRGRFRKDEVIAVQRTESEKWLNP